MRRPPGILEHGNLIVERLPLSTEYMGPGDDNVDFIRAGLYGAPDFGDSFGTRRQPGRESRRDRGHVNSASFNSAARRLDESVIDAHGRHLDLQAFDTKLLHDFLLERLPRLGTEPKHAFIRVVTRKRGEVYARDGAQQPRGLPLFFHRTASHQGLRSPLHGAGVHANGTYPIYIQRNAAV